MGSPYLTKSDFKACFDCATKLFYRKNGYPSNQDDNEYLRFLAEGGFMIETVAKARYPSKHDLVGERDPVKAYERTEAILAADPDAIIYEAAALHERYQARIDILCRRGDTLELIEVKSSSLFVDSEENDAESHFLSSSGEVQGRWREYLLDVTFQLYVARLAFPGYKILPRLCVVNKATTVGPQETLQQFSLFKVNPADSKARPEVRYLGDPAVLQNSKLVVVRPVERETALLMDEVVARAKQLVSLLDSNGAIRRQAGSVAELYKVCRVCEYRFPTDRAPRPHGFEECWGNLASATPHLLDLHRVGQIGSKNFADPIPPLLESGRASILDLREDQLGAKGSKYTNRRLMQWTHHRNGGTEHLPDSLKRELVSHQQDPGWPLHFVDFEACDIALPHHAGMRPYERVAFQWSCHTLNKSGSIKHREWINTELAFPNFKFAQSLREHLGETGTVYVWSPYEQATLQRILTQIEEWLKRDWEEAVRVSGLATRAELEDLADWIHRLLGPEDDKGRRQASPRIRDLHKLALEYYFHPEMLGRTSIKVVLPAIWRHSKMLQTDPWFKKYYRARSDSTPESPYKTLPEEQLGGGSEDADVVDNGTGAIRVYQNLLFRREDDSVIRANRQKLLLQYCELDTAAMVMIWKHWSQEDSLRPDRPSG